MAKRIIRHAKRNKLMWKLILFVIVLIGSTAVLFDSLQTAPAIQRQPIG